MSKVKHTLTYSLGDMINKFDDSPCSDVQTFNNIFKHCPITGFNSNDEVSIGEPITCLTRMVNINGVDFLHDFRFLSSEKYEDQTDKELL